MNPLLANPPTVTTKSPLVAPAGIGTVMAVTLQLIGVAVIPLKLTVLVPCVAPNVVPPIVTISPTTPEPGVTLLIFGATAKVTLLLGTPPTVTITGPVVAFAGTGTVMRELVQFVGVAATPLKATVLEPCVAPKVVPSMVIESPTTPEPGERAVILGPTVKD